jgi:adenylate cyclase class IV
MASLFECEVRYQIADIRALENRLRELNAIIVYPYESTDYYFCPVNEQWNPSEKNLRIRELITPKEQSAIYFVKTEIVTIGDIGFKRALYPQGKVPLFSGDFDTCWSLVEDMGFQLWLTVKKTKAKLWEIPAHGFKTAVEYIEELGWNGELEFEGEKPEEAKEHIEKALEILRIPREAVSSKPISALCAEKKGML